MGISTVLALAGIGIAAFFFLKRRDAADAAARRFAGLHRLLLNKYYVDELYDATIVQPIKRLSTGVLWKVVDADVIDGTVNGVGHDRPGRRRAAAPAADRLGACLRRGAVPGGRRDRGVLPVAVARQVHRRTLEGNR